MTTANIISIIRICLIPVFILFALLGFPGSSYAAVAIFILASITD